MSSGKYDKIGNYNLSYELLKDAVKEFDGYLVGLSQNDIWLFSKELTRPKKVDPDSNLITFLKQVAPRILDRTTGTYFFINLVDIGGIGSLSKHTNFDYDGNFLRTAMTMVPGYFVQNKAGKLVNAMRGFTQDKIITTDNVIQFTESQELQATVQAPEGVNLTGTEELGMLKGVLELGADSVLVHDVDNQKIIALRAQDPEQKLQTINDCLLYYNVTGIKQDKLLDKNGEVQYSDKDEKDPN